jgi:curved DNA-binding protein CbpA
VAPSPDYYEVLQVSPNADGEIIQVAYELLVEKWAPYRNPCDPSVAELILRLDEAYAVLSNPQKRREYDARRREPVTASEVREQPTHTTAEPHKTPAASPCPPPCEARVSTPHPPKERVDGWGVALALGIVVALVVGAATSGERQQTAEQPAAAAARPSPTSQTRLVTPSEVKRDQGTSSRGAATPEQGEPRLDPKADAWVAERSRAIVAEAASGRADLGSVFMGNWR